MLKININMLKKFYIVVLVLLSLVLLSTITVSIIYILKYFSKEEACPECVYVELDCSVKTSIVGSVKASKPFGTVAYNLVDSSSYSSSVNLKSSSFDFGQNQITLTDITSQGFSWKLESSSNSFPSVLIFDSFPVQTFEEIAWATTKILDGYGIMIPGTLFYWRISPNSYFQNFDENQEVAMPLKLRYCKQIFKTKEDFPIVVFINTDFEESSLFVHRADDVQGSSWQTSIISIDEAYLVPKIHGGLVQSSKDKNVMGFVYLATSLELIIAQSKDGFKTVDKFVIIQPPDTQIIQDSNSITVMTNDKDELFVFTTTKNGKSTQYRSDSILAPTFDITIIGYAIGFENTSVSWSFGFIDDILFAYASQSYRDTSSSFLLDSSDRFETIRMGIITQNIYESKSVNSFAKFIKLGNEHRIYVYSQLEPENDFPSACVYISSFDQGKTWTEQKNVFQTDKPGSASLATLQIDDDSALIATICPAQSRFLTTKIEGVPIEKDIEFSYSIF